MATLKQFLTTGQLGDIAVGISQGEVLRLLGEPEAKGGGDKAVIWKYGPLQVTFNKAADCTAIGMIVLCTGNGPMPKSIHLEGWVPGPNTNFEDFKHFLEDNKLQDRLQSGFSSDTQLNYVLEPNAEAIFSLESGRTKLEKILYADRLARKGENRQLSIFVPASYLKSLQALASARKTSMTKLCSDWVLERVEREVEQSASNGITEQIKAQTP